MGFEVQDEAVTTRDRYQARAQVIAAIIGALIAGLFAGLLGGRKLEERTLESQSAASEEAINQLRSELADRSKLIESLRARVDAQEQMIKDLRPNPTEGSPQEESRPSASAQLAGVSEGAASPASAPKEVVISVQEVAGIEMGLRGCQRSGPRVTCDFNVVNHDSDRSLEICAPACYGNRSRLVDSQGIEYSPDASYLGGGYTHRPTAVLAWEVPLRAGLRFEGVDPRSMSIKLLEVGIRVRFGHDYQLQFRDVRLE